MFFSMSLFAYDGDYYDAHETYRYIKEVYEDGQKREALEQLVEWFPKIPVEGEWNSDSDYIILARKVIKDGLKTLYYTQADKLLFDKVYAIAKGNSVLQENNLGWFIKLYKSFFNNEEITWYTGEYLNDWGSKCISIGISKDAPEWPFSIINSILPYSDGYKIQFCMWGNGYLYYDFFAKPGTIFYTDCSFDLEITSIQPNSFTVIFKKKKPGKKPKTN